MCAPIIPSNHVPQTPSDVRSLQRRDYISTICLTPTALLSPGLGFDFSGLLLPHQNLSMLDTLPLRLSKFPVVNSLSQYESTNCYSPKYYLGNM